MKKFYKPLIASMMLAAGISAYAANVDQTTGSTDDYTWEYWNDAHDNGEYYPNWKFTFTPELDAEPANFAVNFVLKKAVGGEVVRDGAANRTWMGTTGSSFYTGLGVLEAGEYMMESIVTFIKAGTSDPIIANLTPVTFSVAGVPTDLPVAKLNYEVVNGPTTAYFNYNIELENIDPESVTAYRVWLDAPGNIMMGESTTQEGSIGIDVSDGNHTYWVKGQVTYTDGNGDTKTINTNPNDQGVDFKQVSDPNAVIPTLGVTAGTPVALTATTGELPFTITTDKPELEGVSYHVYCVTEGDKQVGEMTTTELEGTLPLSNLNPGNITNLWLKVQGTVGEDVTNIAQYPGEAQGWSGLSIDTSEFADPNMPVMPQITLAAMDAEQTGADTATLRYEVTLSSEQFFKSLYIKVVTNAFGGPDVVLCEVDETTELSGTLELTGLKPEALNELWVKAVVTITDDTKSDEVVYPGPAQGWTGLSIEMQAVEAINEVNAADNAPVEYYNLQGVRVENPANGLYIRRQGSKVAKVIL